VGYWNKEFAVGGFFELALRSLWIVIRGGQMDEEPVNHVFLSTFRIPPRIKYLTHSG